MIEVVLKAPDNAKVVIQKTDVTIDLFDGNDVQIDERVFKTELTCRAFYNYLLLAYKDMGWTRC